MTSDFNDKIQDETTTWYEYEWRYVHCDHKHIVT